jgi:hypothetical protein
MDNQLSPIYLSRKRYIVRRYVYDWFYIALPDLFGLSPSQFIIFLLLV